METVLKTYISGKYLKNIVLIAALILLNLIIIKGSAWSQDLDITGTPPPALQNEFYRFIPEIYNAVGKTTFQEINLPKWANFNSETGEISSKTGLSYPLNEHVGLYENIGIVVSDEGGSSDMLGPFSIEVQNVNDAPIIYDLAGNPIASPLPDSTEHVEYNYEFLAFDPDLTLNVNESLTIGLIGAPSWLSISTGVPDIKTGTIKASLKGTPGDKEPGNTYSFQISVVDKQNIRMVTNLLELYVQNVNDKPVISGTPATEVKQGETYSFTPEFKDLDLNLVENFGDKIKFSVTFGADGNAPMPDWLLFNSETGQLSSKQGRPVNNDVGLVENIVISISDSISDNTQDNSLPGFDLCVKNVNDRPVITKTLEIPAAGNVKQAIEGEQVAQGESFSMLLSVSDIDLTLTQRSCNTIRDNIAFAGINLPEWLEIIEDPENPLIARVVNIENRPNNDEVGPWQDIEIAVTDGQGGIARLVFNLNVENQNDKPFFTQVPVQNIIINEDQAVNFIPFSPESGSEIDSNKTNIIKANDIDMKYGDQLYFTLDYPSEYDTKLSRWLGIKAKNSTDAELTGVPKNEDVGIYSDIRLIVSDRPDVNDPERKTGEYMFNIEVVNTNDPPVFDIVPPNDTPVEIDAGTPWSQAPDQYAKVRAYDVDQGDSVRYSLASKPAPAWMIINSDGILSGTPSNRSAGINTITITAEDIYGAKSQWTFTVKVNYVNNVPVINTGSLPPYLIYEVYEDDFFNHTIIVGDSDKYYGDILTYKLENAPSWLKISKDGAQNAVLSGVPQASDIKKNIGIKLTVTDSYNMSDFAVFNIEVKFVDDYPVISGSLPTAVVGRDYYYKPYYYDEEGDNLCFRMDTEMEWLTIDETTGLLTGMPFKKDLGEKLISIYVYECSDDIKESQLGPVILKVIGLEIIVLPGDIDASGTIDLKDCILGLKILADIPLPISISKHGGLNGERIIGLREVIYILRKSAGIIN